MIRDRSTYYMLRVRFAVLLLFLCISFLATAQEKRDSVLVRAGSILQLGDSLLYVPRDSLMYLPENATLFLDQQKIYESRQLYQSLRDSARNQWLKSLYDLLLVPQNKPLSARGEYRPDQFKPFEGRRIRDILIRRLPPFGSSVSDPFVSDSAWINNFLNSTHFRTRENKVRALLKFSTGDQLNPFLLADNERIIRQLSFIKDCRIVVIPVQNQEVDLLVITKDIYSLGANLEISDVKSGTTELYEQNFLGLGHEINLKTRYAFEEYDKPQLQFSYTLNNVLRSFTDIRLSYLKGFDDEVKSVHINRRFLTPYDKWAAGIKIDRTDTKDRLDTLPEPLPLRLNYQDYWLGRSFLLNPEQRSRLIVSGRHISNKIFERPDINENSYYELQTFKLYLFSLTYAKQNYFTTHLMYDFGRSEDIPNGCLYSLTMGFENNEFKQRRFYGADVSRSFRIPSLGYIRSDISISGFHTENQFEQGLASIKVTGISNLLQSKSHFFRTFLSFGYSRGIQRFEDEKLTLNGSNGIRGFRSDSVLGSERFCMQAENVLFSPLYVYGFRFVFFGFADLGWINNSPSSPLSSSEFYSGFGLGLRIKNDNMAFRALQIRFAFYPRVPLAGKLDYLDIQTQPANLIRDFDVYPPKIPDYR